MKSSNILKYYNMQANRQTKYQNHTKIKPGFKKLLFKDQLSCTQQKNRLSLLIDRFPLQNIRLNCNQVITIQKNKQPSYTNIFEYRKAQQRVQIYCESVPNLLLQCFNNLQNGDKHQYIFVGNHKKYSQNDRKNHQPKSSVLVDTQILNENWEHKESLQKLNRMNQSSKIKNKNQKNEVEQQLQLLNDDNSSLLNQEQKEEQQISCQQKEVFNSKQILITKNSQQNQQKLHPLPILKEQKIIQGVFPLPCQSSFNNFLQNGFIQHQLLDKEQNYMCIFGDEEIQAQKLQRNWKRQNMQLSSIQALLAKSQSADKKSSLKDEQSVQNLQSKCQKICLEELAEKRQKNSEDIVEITEKIIEPNHTEYYVRYNFSALQTKNTRTEVIRVSPLKFRKKEKVSVLEANHSTQPNKFS